MEQPRRLSRLARACAMSLLSMTEGEWRYYITSCDPYGMSVTYARERALPGQTEDELLALLGLGEYSCRADAGDPGRGGRPLGTVAGTRAG